MSDDIDPDRKFSNGSEWDNSIDWDDASDGSDGGYDRHGSPINANAMKELVQLRMETSRLRADLAAVTEERDRLREALQPFDDFPLHKWDGIGDDHVLYGPFTLGHVRKYLSGSCQAILDNSNYPEKPDSCARTALKGE